MANPKLEYMSDLWKDGLFNNRVVFVTGGAGDICSAQTKALVHLGADACIIGRNPTKTENMAKEIAAIRKGAKVIGIAADVRKFEDLKAAADRCVAELGAIDFVIAGAAGNFVAPISGLTPNGFKTVMDIDTIGTFNTVKATIDHLVASAARNPNPSPVGQTGGRIIFVSASFHFTGLPLQTHAAAAKAGVDAIMAGVALEYGPRGVNSNVVTPGAIRGTEGMQRLSSTHNRSKGLEARRIPTPRYGLRRDISDATIYLFSEAGSYVNGHALVVDGAAWRRQGGSTPVGVDPDMQYPDFLLNNTISEHIKSGRKEKSKL